MAKVSARWLLSAIRGSIAGAFALIVLVHPAAASLLEFTFTSDFTAFPGGGSFFLDTSVAAQPGGPGSSPVYPTLYPNAIKNYQYKGPFQSNSLLEATLLVWPDITPIQDAPSLTEFNFGDSPVGAGLGLNLANQPSLGFQLSSDPAFYQLNTYWASFVNNSPFLVNSLEAEIVQQIPWPPYLSLLALLTLAVWLILWRGGERRQH